MIQKIRDMDGNWVDGTNDVADTALNYFDQLFSAEDTQEDSNILSVINKVIPNVDNILLVSIPTLQEITEAVFSINVDNSPRPDSLNGKFYQACWYIISSDIFNVVVSFFQGAILPKFFTHTCIIMLLKVDSPQSFSDIRLGA